MENLKFALAGNPNSGKTTLFNALTGSTAHVGNWPGVTVDKKEGVYKKGKAPVAIVDLPGIYSLSPYTPEEVIARNYILDERPDCIINIVDATNLERNLYLTTQLLEVDIPLVIALNMSDVLEKNGDKIDVAALEAKIGVPVVEISALRETNVGKLMQRAVEAAKKSRAAFSVLKKTSLFAAIENAEIAFKLNGVKAPLFHAVKLVEKDDIEVQNHPKEAQAAAEFLAKNGSGNPDFAGDTEAEIADARYKYISENFSIALKRAKTKKKGEMTKSDKIDRVLTNKWAGIPIFLAVLFLVFHFTFSEDLFYLGAITGGFNGWVEAETTTKAGEIFKGIFFADGLNSPGVILFNVMDVITSQIGEWLTAGIEGLGAHPGLVDFLVEGVWGGIAGVLSFLPQILVLFVFFSILEDSGYMARVAFLLDRIFRRFGVSGRAFMPMFMGFGCSVPAMINTRTMPDRKEREATIRVIPFFTCGAKVPILIAIAGGIASMMDNGNLASLVTYSMYVLGVVAAIVALLILRHTTYRGETSPFIMELPSYHFPRFKNLMIHIWDKTKHYVKKAFTIILVSCIAIRFLQTFDWSWHYVGEDGMTDSILADIGRFIQPIFTPFGFGSQIPEYGWVFAVAAITGLIAKENVIATFGILAAGLAAIAGNPEFIAEEEALEEGIVQVEYLIQMTGINVSQLLAFIVFNMLTIPCFAAVATARGEIGKKTFKNTLGFWMAASFLGAAIIYVLCEMIRTWQVGWILGGVAIILAIAAAIVGIVLYNKKMNEKEAHARLSLNK